MLTEAAADALIHAAAEIVAEYPLCRGLWYAYYCEQMWVMMEIQAMSPAMVLDIVQLQLVPILVEHGIDNAVRISWGPSSGLCAIPHRFLLA